MNSLLLRAATIAGVVSIFAVANADQLYLQPTNYDGSVSSQNDTTPGGYGGFATAYDNFTLGATSDVTNVQWIGSYFNPPSAGTITAFTLNFYADSAGTPGALLASNSIAGNAGETSLGNDNADDPTYIYGANVASFQATAGTQYWLSIVPDLAFPPQWGWEDGTGGDGASYQVFFGTGAPVGTDLTFQLNGSAATPEPTSFLALGGAALLVGRRRFKKA